ncbi:MAG: hypothetical protein PUG15_03265 [Bacteroidales bacterium]|nr:hypothetical protein [Bacteroidales bacterium]
MLYKDEQPIETRIYIGGYEKLANSLGNIVELHYISGGNGLCR